MTIGRIPSVEGGIQPTIVDAKGDLIAAVAADSVNRLAVGSNDQVLVADSGASTGLAWKSYGSQLSSSNPVLNSDFSIWQRGTSIAVASSSATSYTADRWLGYRAATGSTISRQTTGDTTNLPFVQYCARVQRDSGNTSTSLIDLIQPFESTNAIPFVGKTVTLSFYARRGANFSSSSNLMGFSLTTGTGTDQNPITVYTGSTAAISGNATLTTTWQRFTATGTLSASATEMFIEFFYTPTGTAGAADFFEITGVQLDVGSVAQPFRRAMNTIQGELAACQRYYQRLTANNAFGWFPAWAGTTSTTAFQLTYPLITQMRVGPTSLEYGGNLQLKNAADSGFAISSLTYAGVTTPTVGSASGVVASTTSGAYYRLQANNDTTAYIAWSAEL